MNLWVKKIGPILGLALFLFTCEEPGEIGLELDPDVGNFLGSYIELSVNVGALKSEPYFLSKIDSALAISNNDSSYIHYLRRVSNLAIGAFDSETFGKSKVTAFAQIVPLSFPATIEANASYENIEFIFNISGYFGDSLEVAKTQYFDIYELTEPMDSVNFSNTEYTYSNTLIGTATVNIDEDTTNTSITTTLTDEFGLKLFNELKDTTNNATKSDTAFINFFNGLAFVPHDESTITCNINPISSTRIELNYTLDGTAKIKTFVMDGIFSQYVGVDFSGTPLETLAENTPDYDVENLNLSSVNGILGELDFKPFFELRDSIGAMAINKATLLFEGNEIKSFYRLPSTIDLFYQESSLFDIRELPFFANSNQNIDFTHVVSCGPRLDSLTNTITYSASLGNVLTNLLVNKDKSFKLLVAPANYGKVPTQVLIDKQKVKLRIYFSHIKSEL